MKELKFKKMEEAYKKLQKELADSKAELRQEKKNNIELIKLVEKLDKKVTIKEQTQDRFDLIETELNLMKESFEKSEMIRREQKILI